MKKFLTAVIIIAALAVMGAVGYSVYNMYTVNRRYEDLPYTAAQYDALKAFYETQANDCADIVEITKDEWKVKVNDMLGVYAYLEVPYLVPEDCAGVSYYFLSTIAIDETLTGAYYAHVLTHELLHFLNPTNSERQTEFLAFKIAFESSDPQMRLVALESISETINRTDGNNSIDYICTGRIIDYLERRGLL